MGLKVTLRPNEQIIVNGCSIRNTGRTHGLHIESRADVLRGKDLLPLDEATTPVSRVYFLVQIALIYPPTREGLLPKIQSGMADLALVFGGENLKHVFEAANMVSQFDFYKALTHLRPLLRHERRLLGLLDEPDNQVRVLRAATG
jgi:flagellar biosynthesis repressor protein FlbT